MSASCDAAERNARKTLALARAVDSATSILVVGCGDGREAGLLAKHFRAATVGVGINDGRFLCGSAAPARLCEMDARRLAFAAKSFDLVYSFHALEHIREPEQALREMRRVLVSGGRYLLGTPNKSRLVGYLGAAEPLSARVRSNLGDYRARLAGRWSNEAGAHAGFTRQDLTAMCQEHIGPARDVTDDYYERLYAGRAGGIRVLRRVGLTDRLYPAVYVAGRAAP